MNRTTLAPPRRAYLLTVSAVGKKKNGSLRVRCSRLQRTSCYAADWLTFERVKKRAGPVNVSSMSSFSAHAHDRRTTNSTSARQQRLLRLPVFAVSVRPVSKRRRERYLRDPGRVRRFFVDRRANPNGDDGYVRVLLSPSFRYVHDGGSCGSDDDIKGNEKL